jgi:hypothetical protein
VSSDVHYFSPTTPGAASFDVDVSDFVRRGRIGPLSGEAQMAAVGSGVCVLDDIDSTVGHLSDGIVGLKQWYWNETECPSGNQRVYTGYTFDRRYTRGDSLVTGPSRLIDVTLMDPNAFLSFRIFAPESVDPTSSFVRPAEDTDARIAALLAVDFLSTTLFDLGYIPTTGHKPMDAHDYTGQKPFDVVNDIAQVLGWNPWVGYDETENKLFLWFDDWKTDGTATVPYDSTLRLTNVEAEQDATTLLAQQWPVETVDPSRVISAVYVIGKGKTVYRTNPTTANKFGWRDAVMQAQFLSDETKLNDLGDRYLLDNATEDHKIAVSVQVPAALVTAIHEGMRIQAHFTHCPSVASGFVWCRILHRTVRRDIDTMEFYWLDLELSPIPTPEPVYSILYRTESVHTDVSNPAPCYFDSSGDRPDVGFLPDPTIGPVEQIPGPDYPGTGTFEWWGFRSLGVGEVSLQLDSTVAGVPIIGDTVTVTIEIDGVVVGTDAAGPAVANFTWAPGDNVISITVTDAPVVYGSEIFVWVTASRPVGFFLPQFGAGGNFVLTGNITPP